MRALRNTKYVYISGIEVVVVVEEGEGEEDVVVI